MWCLFIAGLAYSAFQICSKKSRGYIKHTPTFESDEHDEMTLQKNLKQRTQLKVDNIVNQWNELRCDQPIEYDNIDDVTRVEYQQREHYTES